MVLLALSIIGGNLPNSYSLALSFQNVHPWFIKVPRFLWTTIGTAFYIGIGIAAAYDFSESLTTFMSILSYYLAMYTTIVLEEHFIFRHRNFANYPLEGWNDKISSSVWICVNARFLFRYYGCCPRNGSGLVYWGYRGTNR